MDQEIKLVIGGLLHDIGKVIYRKGDHRSHSQSGYEYLKEQKITDQEILDCVRYHHSSVLKHAEIDEQSLAYIVYMADNIASAADRRKNEDGDYGFEASMPLRPVFNILNGNHSDDYYSPYLLDRESEINYPMKEKKTFTEAQYSRIMENISFNLQGITYTQDYIDSLLEVLEANLSFVPSSTSMSEQADISLYDHVKLTAALAVSIFQYVNELGITDYHNILYREASSFYDQQVFLLISLDISGIQRFIYTISSKNALRTLRARSFYLEIMMEHLIDQLLERLKLTRTNLIYSGGGHCYILAANTLYSKEQVDQFIRETNQWFLEHFQTALYIAGGYTACSSNALRNVPEGSYERLYRELAACLSRMKGHRYMAEQILQLNYLEYADYTRECKVCRNIGKTNAEGVCTICDSIAKLSKNILYDEFFSVVSAKETTGIPLPGGYWLVADAGEQELKRRMTQDPGLVRVYGKNRMYTGKKIASKLWVASYTRGNTFEEFAREAEGANRIGVLRADVDNLGHAFVAGFSDPNNNNRFVTLSRTATLSRQLSIFFKHYIDQILNNPQMTLNAKQGKNYRNATIVYSGGDDVFIVGAWDDIIALSVDLRDAFQKFTENTLTISAGIGIYHDNYPISAIAQEVAKQENESKNYPGKDAVTLLEDGGTHQEWNMDKEITIGDGTYNWNIFRDQVLGEKYRVIKTFFDQSENRGKSFLYKIYELLCGQEERINFARYVYLLSRMEPKEEASGPEQKLYQKFSEKMYQWIQKNQDRRELKTAIIIYAYLTREKEGITDEYNQQ